MGTTLTAQSLPWGPHLDSYWLGDGADNENTGFAAVQQFVHRRDLQEILSFHQPRTIELTGGEASSKQAPRRMNLQDDSEPLRS